MKRKFKKRYIKKNKNEIYSKLLFVCLFIFSVSTVLGYSLYRETINRLIALSVTRPTFTITLDNQSGTTAGTSTIYVKYLDGYYLNSNLTNKMTTSANPITPPTKTGLVFMGYYTEEHGLGEQYIDSEGKITSNASTINFTANGTLYAYYDQLMARNLSYDNTNTEVDCSDSQCMIDYLADMIDPTPTYYAFGDPTTSSTTDYTTLNKSIFVAKKNNRKSVCIIRNNQLHCFKNNNYDYEKDHVQQVFSDISCPVNSSGVQCRATDFTCIVHSNGGVYCYVYGTDEECYVDTDGSVSCS